MTKEELVKKANEGLDAIETLMNRFSNVLEWSDGKEWRQVKKPLYDTNNHMQLRLKQTGQKPECESTESSSE